MGQRETDYHANVTENVTANAADLDAARASVVEQVEDGLTDNAADLSHVVGELTGQADLRMEANAREMLKPLTKFREKAESVLTDNYRDLAGAGYEPHVYLTDVQADLSDPDQLAVLLKRMAAPQARTLIDTNQPGGAPCTPDRPDCTGNIPTNGTLQPPPTPPAAQPSPDCFPAGQLDPAHPDRLICVKGGEGTPGVPPPPPEPVVIPAPPGETCSPSVVQMPACPAPVIVVQAPNPANLGPGEPSPGQKEPPAEPVCPEPVEPVINVNVPAPVVNLPKPEEQPHFKFAKLDPNPAGPRLAALDTDDGCDRLKEACDDWNRIVFAAAGPIQDVADVLTPVFGKWVSNTLHVAQTITGPVLNFLFTGFSDVKDDSQEAFTARMTAAQFSSVRFLQTFVKNNFGDDAACAMAPAAAAANAVGFADQLPFDFRYFVTPLEYERNYIFPVYIPEQPAIDALWLGDRITDEQHTCYTRAHGNLPHLHRIVAEEKRERPNADEWVRLFLRGKVDQDRMFRELRKLGWLDQSEAARKVSLYEAIPTFGDVIRFMIRDTENPAAVAAGELDKGFEANYNGQLKTWGTANGVSEDLARRYWRAHWRWISNTEGFEMIHRLRPGVVDENLVTTADDVRKVLEINDVAPHFLDRLIAISYRPLTRVDVRRAYEIGVLTADDVTSSYLDLGYSQQNADTLTRFTVRQKEQKEARKVNVWSLAQVAAAYREGTIDPGFAFAKARVFLDTDEAAEQFLRDVDQRRDAEMRKRCIASLRKRYMTGEFDFLRGADEVGKVVADQRAAETIVRGWECERSNRRREVAAGTLCKWMGQGIITADEYLIRLSNLGYGEGDARRMLASCGQDIFEAERRKALSAAKRNLDEYRKRQAELKKNIADLEKRLKQLQSQNANVNGVHA